LYDRINRRVDAMFEAGLEEEARTLLLYKTLNSLNTVGYRELFDHFDGLCTLDEAREKIKANSRKYARKQLTWFRRDPEVKWFHPSEDAEIISSLDDIVASGR
jgi:tRNA dimethylallyltransferase